MSVSQSQYNAILRQYDKKRLLLRHIQEEKQNEIYRKVPRIKEIDDTISTLSVSTAKRILFSNDSSLADFKEEMANLRKEKETLMLAYFPKGFLDLPYECSECRDTGYVGNMKCNCLKKQIIDVLYEQSNLKEILSKENFDSFDFSLYPDDIVDSNTKLSARENITNAVNYAKDFITNFNDISKNSLPNILLYGETGVGKTYLTNCIAKELMDKSKSVVYLSAIRLMEILADSAFDREPYAKEQRINIFEADLLIIDDLGTEMQNNFSASAFFNCINERSLAKKPIIISTNLSLQEIRERYSERVFSRITSTYKLYKIYGNDLRLKTYKNTQMK